MTVPDEILEVLPSQLSGAAEDMEIYVERRRRLAIQVKERQVEALQEARETGVAVRCAQSGRIGFAYTTDPAPEALRQVVADAMSSLDAVEVKHPQWLPDLAACPVPPELQQYDETLVQRPIQQKIDTALHLEQAARDHDPRVRQVRMCAYQESHDEVWLWRRTGTRSFQRTLCQGSLTAISGDEHGQESAWNMGFAPFFEELDCRAIATEAAAEAVGKLGATSLATGSYPAVLDRAVVAALLGILAPSFLGESVQKHKSRLAGQQGQPVYAAPVTLVDDGRFPGGMATAPFDGEGVPSQRTALVSQGVLAGYLYDAATGHRDGRPSTGNSVRTGYKELPRPGTRNFYLEAGPEAPDPLYAGITHGIAIHDVIGMHTANPITGDFSVGASGYRIENGRKGPAVRGFAISGNLHHIFKSVDSVGSDLKFYGTVGAPSVRITQIAVGGT